MLRDSEFYKVFLIPLTSVVDISLTTLFLQSERGYEYYNNSTVETTDGVVKLCGSEDKWYEMLSVKKETSDI